MSLHSSAEGRYNMHYGLVATWNFTVVPIHTAHLTVTAWRRTSPRLPMPSAKSAHRATRRAFPHAILASLNLGRRAIPPRCIVNGRTGAWAGRRCERISASPAPHQPITWSVTSHVDHPRAQHTHAPPGPPATASPLVVGPAAALSMPLVEGTRTPHCTTRARLRGNGTIAPRHPAAPMQLRLWMRAGMGRRGEHTPQDGIDRGFV